jgi:amino acid transporter
MTRLARAWGALRPEQRLAAVAALALWVTLLLPWYHKNVTESSHGRLQAVGHNVTGFGTFSFVEAAVLLVSVGVLAMLFARGERRSFHLPGSDGLIVMLAGGWVALLVFYRMLDTPSLSQRGGSVVTDVGVQWGIFLALMAAAAVAYAGWGMRAAATPEPPLVRRSRREPPSEEDVTVAVPSTPNPQRARPVAARPSTRPRYPPAPSDQLSFDDATEKQDQ